MNRFQKIASAWRKIGDKEKYYRSAWEANMARWLQYQKEKGWILDWEHEPKTFWFPGIKRGCVSYKPDFCVYKLDGSCEWVEVKGYFDSKSLTKIKRFRKYFPDETLKVVDQEFFKKNNAKLSLLVKDWE